MNILTIEEALQRKPQECWNCKSKNIIYWDETDEEIVFQCNDCKGKIPIPFDNNKLRFYFFF